MKHLEDRTVNSPHAERGKPDSHPRVLNRLHLKTPPANSVYVGRPGPFGNPFTIDVDGSRKVVIQKFEKWLKTQPALIDRIKRELKGKDLICWCAPRPCHADVLLRIANAP